MVTGVEEEEFWTTRGLVVEGGVMIWTGEEDIGNGGVKVSGGKETLVLDEEEGWSDEDGLVSSGAKGFREVIQGEGGREPNLVETEVIGRSLKTAASPKT